MQLAGTCIPARGLQGPLGHPSTFFAAWFVPGGCCDPQGCPCATARPSPHLERRCHFGVKQFKLLEQVWGDSGGRIFHSLLFSLAKVIYFHQTHPVPLLLALL